LIKKTGRAMKYSKLPLIICISAIFLSISCNPVFLGPNLGPTTAILGALDEEVATIQEKLTDKQEQTIEGIKFVSGRLQNRRVVVAKTGIGKVNAAMTATLLIEHFRPNEVIFTGIAGGINPELSFGDTVIAEKTAQHDLGIWTSDGFENRGEINPFNGRRNPVFFPADQQLLKFAEQAAKEVTLDKIKTDTEERPPKIVKGVVVTGDVFVASTAKRAELRKRLGADAVEMEGAAVAQICYQQSIPCIVIRSISDKAGEKAMDDLDSHLKIAAKNSANLVIRIVEHLSLELSVEKNWKNQ